MQRNYILSKIREPFNGLSHLISAIVAIIGGIPLLIASWSGPEKIISAVVYLSSLVAMFLASGVYHLARVKPNALARLRKLDHSAIFLLIAGTYTPFCLIAFTGFWRWGFLAIIWVIAILGILVKVFFPGVPRWLHTATYVVMGWLCMLAAPQMPSALPSSTIVWLIVGGIIYTFGAIVYATRIFNFIPGKFGFHEVWHIFVILGAASHFAAVVTVIVHS